MAKDRDRNFDDEQDAQERLNRQGNGPKWSECERLIGDILDVNWQMWWDEPPTASTLTDIAYAVMTQMKPAEFLAAHVERYGPKDPIHAINETLNRSRELLEEQKTIIDDFKTYTETLREGLHDESTVTSESGNGESQG